MNSLDRQTEYWDKVAEDKNFSHPLDETRLRSLIPRDATILDYGCGYGRTCDELVRLGYQDVLGIDISERMIQRGQRLFPHLNLEVLRKERLPCEDNTFDAVLLFAVLTCIPTNSGQKELVGDIHRVLRPGGILYVSDYPLQTDKRNRSRYREFEERHGVFGVFELPEGAAVRHHDMKWITSLLSSFDRLHLEKTEVLTMNRNRAGIFQYFCRKLVL